MREERGTVPRGVHRDKNRQAHTSFRNPSLLSGLSCPNSIRLRPSLGPRPWSGSGEGLGPTGWSDDGDPTRGVVGPLPLHQDQGTGETRVRATDRELA